MTSNGHCLQIIGGNFHVLGGKILMPVRLSQQVSGGHGNWVSAYLIH